MSFDMSKADQTSTYDLLFSLLRSALLGETCPVEIDDFAALLREAQRQAVDGLLYALPQLSVGEAERPLLKQWIGGLLPLEMANRQMNQVVVELARAFDAAHLRYVLLKGQSCAAVYPQPLLRRAGDIDLYIAPQHFEEAKCVLQNLGFVFDHQTLLHEVFERKGVTVELHRALQPMQWPPAVKHLKQMMHKEVDTVGEWQHFVEIDGYNVPILPPHLNVVLLTAHIMVHATHLGIGLRQLVDWGMVLTTYGHRLDRALLKNALSQLHLTRFYRILSAFSVEYLGFAAHHFDLLLLEKDNSTSVIAASATDSSASFIASSPDSSSIVPSSDSSLYSSSSSNLKHPYSSFDALRAKSLLKWSIKVGNHARFGSSFSRNGGFLAHSCIYFYNMLQHFWWIPTEYLGIPWYMLRRALYRLSFMKHP
jgi:hypothetical protein